MKKNVVLIVDDSEFDRNLMTKALEKKGGFHTLEASNGDQCLEIVDAAPVDLILMDIMMPGTLGSQVLVKIREKFNPIELPIIMITALTNNSPLMVCLQSGANDYITKPLNFEVAVSRINTHLKLAELSHEMSRLDKMAALNAMIATYNHEINNPLAIAMLCLRETNWDKPGNREKLEDALERIRKIVKKIKYVTEGHDIEYEKYEGLTDLLKIK